MIEDTVHRVLASNRKFIGNPDSNKAHIPAISENRTQSAFWHAACGWPYGRRNHIGLAKLKEPWTMCEKCVQAKAYYDQIDHEGDDL